MKIFLTGGTGYIGENLALTLKSQNHEIFALVRSIEKGAVLASAGIHLIPGDLNNKQAIDNGMKGCDVVFHLAAFAKLWPDDEAMYKKINVEGTRNILLAAKKNNIRKVIVTSTAGVFGPSEIGGLPLNEESSRIAPYFNYYESTKAEAEEVVREFAKNGLDAVIVNPPRVYGPGRKSESNAISKLIELYLEGKWRFIPGDGKRLGSYSYIDDIVDGHIKALEKGRSGETYLLGGENASYEHFFYLLKKLTGINKKLINVPVFILVFISRLMVLRAFFFNTAPLITPKWVIKYMYDWSVSSKKAKDELDYSITPLEVGMKRTIKWLRNSEEKTYTLITGSSSGIGKAMAEDFARRNQNLILAALPNTGLEKVSKNIQDKYGVDVKFYELNLTEEGAIQKFYDWCVNQNLSINTLINNAGIGDCSCFENTDMNFYLNMMQLNSLSVVSLTRIFIPKLREHQKSYILNMGSFAALMPVPFKSVYSATKSFVLAFSKALQMELKDYGIQVSCVCPGPTKTESLMERHEKFGQKSDFLLMTPEKVAKLAIDGLFRNERVIVPGWKNRMLLRFEAIVPYSLKYYILKRIFQKSVTLDTKSYTLKTQELVKPLAKMN